MTPERSNRITSVLNKRQPDLAVVMEDVKDPHNLFAIMRTCDAVGIQDVYVINTPLKPHRKFGSGSSSGAAKWLTIHRYDTVEECMLEVKSRYDNIFASYLDKNTSSFYDLDYTRSIALVFGNEKIGVSDELLTYCNGTFYIPQAGMIRSLNVSVACAVTLYEAKRQRVEKGFYNGEKRLSEERWQILNDEWSMKKDKK